MLCIKVTPFICKHFETCFLPKRGLSEGLNLGLIGRDFINARDYTCSELKSLLWTAADLKCYMKRRQLKALDVLHGCNATVLLNTPHVKAQVAVTNAIRLLGANVNVIIDKHWETSSNVTDLGRCLSRMSDIIIAKANQHDNMCRLRDGASVPVISYASSMYRPLQGLADLLTLQEHYTHLKRLKLGWIGPAEALFNTYLVICPKLGIHIKFACTCHPELPKSPALFDVAAKFCIQHNTEITECITPQDAVYRVDVVATTLHENHNMKITKQIISGAATNWTFLHDLPRSKLEVTDDVFYSPKSLVWASCANMVWVTMALVLQFLREYQPTSTMPNFDGNDVTK